MSTPRNIDAYNPSRHVPDPSLAALVPFAAARKYRLAPLQVAGGVLLAAMVHPMDMVAVDVLEKSTGLEVDALACSEEQLAELFFQLYGGASETELALSHFSDMSIDGDADAGGMDLSLQLQEQTDSGQEETENQAPVIKLVNTILARAVNERASDIHISPEEDKTLIRFRIDGFLRQAPSPHRSFFSPVVSRIKVLANMDISSSRIPQDGRFSFTMEAQRYSVRVSTFPTIYGENMVLRILNQEDQGLAIDELGLSQENKAKLQRVILRPYGLFLSTGPTGSGKTTLQYAVLRTINRPDINIMTLEDPVEYRIKNIRQGQLNRRAGMTFASGLRSILRQDPDVIMVGEIRDLETAAVAIQAAVTGHRVFSTVHTNDAASAVTRLLDMGVEPYLLSSTLQVAIGQRLLRRICPHCAEPAAPPRQALEAMDLTPDDGPFYAGAGCRRCNNTGFLGRTGIFEVLVVDEMLKDMLLHRASAHQIVQAAQKHHGYQTLRMDARRKALEGVTTIAEALSAVIV